MSEERMNNAINKVPVNPDYLAAYLETDESLDLLKQHVTVPRFKILQPTTDADLVKNFGVGSCIVRPGDALVARFNAEPKVFSFVPLYFMIEWAKWRDLNGQGPMILERSADPTSILAEKSKSVDTRKEIYKGMEDADKPMYYQYVEHLRFIGCIYGDHPLAGTPVTLSFERGEWRQGKNFISAVSMRRQVVNGESKPVPLWAQVWNLCTVFHNPEAAKKWYGFGFEAAEQSLVSAEDAPAMLALHNEYKELAQKAKLVVSDDSTPEETDPASVKAATEF